MTESELKPGDIIYADWRNDYSEFQVVAKNPYDTLIKMKGLDLYTTLHERERPWYFHRRPKPSFWSKIFR